MHEQPTPTTATMATSSSRYSIWFIIVQKRSVDAVVHPNLVLVALASAPASRDAVPSSPGFGTEQYATEPSAAGSRGDTHPVLHLHVHVGLQTGVPWPEQLPNEAAGSPDPSDPPEHAVSIGSAHAPLPVFWTQRRACGHLRRTSNGGHWGGRRRIERELAFRGIWRFATCSPLSQSGQTPTRQNHAWQRSPRGRKQGRCPQTQAPRPPCTEAPRGAGVAAGSSPLPRPPSSQALPQGVASGQLHSLALCRAKTERA